MVATGGALAHSPDLDRLQKRKRTLKRRIKARGGDAPGLKKRLKRVNRKIGAFGQDMEDMPTVAGPSFSDITGQSNETLMDLFGRYQDQGAFSPGDFQQQRDAAYDTVMGQFERTMSPQFQQERDQFEQQMAERGIAPGSELYSQLSDQMSQRQGLARQNAMDQAFQLGQGEQAQAYNQAYNTYNVPMQHISALTPYYGYQHQSQMQGDQFGFMNRQNRLDRRHDRRMANLAHQHRLSEIAAQPMPSMGGGGLSYDQQLGLMDREMYNNMVLASLQNGGGYPMPGYGGGFAQGIAGGVGGALGAGLR